MDDIDLDNRVCKRNGCANRLVRRRQTDGRLAPWRLWVKQLYCCRECSAGDMAAKQTAIAAARRANTVDWPKITGHEFRGTPFAEHDIRTRALGRVGLAQTHVASASPLAGGL